MRPTVSDLARRFVAHLAPPRRAHAAADEDFAGYPKDQVLAIFDQRDDAARALDEAHEAGVPSSGIAVYAGDEGAEAIDSSGTGHGMTEVVERSVQFLMTNHDDLHTYQAAVEAGGVVLAIASKDDDRKQLLSSLLQRHNGHDVRHFGAFVVQDLDVDPSRTRTD